MRKNLLAIASGCLFLSLFPVFTACSRDNFEDSASKIINTDVHYAKANIKTAETAALNFYGGF
ncbi:MAG: hypothetical protein ABR503_09155 [Chitinophagaceae bacterium]